MEYLFAATRRSLDLSRRLLVDIRPDQFARQPNLHATLIRTNHPAFVYGHLTLYPGIILSMCGLDATPAAPPEDFSTLFSRGVECRDDPSGTIYPPMPIITDAFFRAWTHALATLPTLSSEILIKPNTDASRSQTFPTIGFALHFLLANHTATHLGQVSAWRRCMGMGPA